MFIQNAEKQDRTTSGGLFRAEKRLLMRREQGKSLSSARLRETLGRGVIEAIKPGSSRLYEPPPREEPVSAFPPYH